MTGGLGSGGLSCSRRICLAQRPICHIISFAGAVCLSVWLTQPLVHRLLFEISGPQKFTH